MRYGAAISGLLHTTIVLLILVGLPKILQSERKGAVPVAVEIVSQDEFARLPEHRKPKPRKSPLKAPERSIMRKSPKQAAQPPEPLPNTSVKTVPPIPPNLETEVVPKPKRKPDAKPSLPKPKPKPKPKQLTASPKKKPTPRPKKKPKFPLDKEKQFLSVLKNLEKQKKLSKLSATKKEDKLAKRTEQKFRRSQFEQRRIAAQLSDAIKRQVSPCWKIQAGAKNAANMEVAIWMRFNQDGSLSAVPRIQDRGRLGNDPFFRAVAESALRALRDPSCVPIKLPYKHYDMWREIVLNFDPKEALGQ